MVQFDSNISELRGVGSSMSSSLHNLNLITIKDLLYHLPTRYEDFREQKTIDTLEENDVVTLLAVVESITKFAPRKNMRIIRAKLADDTGKIDASWFNQDYLLMALKKGTEHYFTGKVVLYKNKKMLSNPSIEKVSEEGRQIHSGRLVPVYPQTEGISSRTLRRLISQAFEQLELIPDNLSISLRKEFHLPDLHTALRTLHFPTEETIEPFRRRLAFEEVYQLLQTARLRKAKEERYTAAHKLSFTATQRKQFELLLPFSLTHSQLSSLLDLSLDLLQKYPTRRLIQGEVGSGKTVTAAFALYLAVLNQTNGFLLAPTQILAHQHFDTLRALFKKHNIPVHLVTTGSAHKKNSRPAIYVGTHVLLNEKELDPSIVVIDEEHRFGVKQRETFWKGKKRPHLITMTATPIPRTVAQTVFADQAVSYLEEIPEKKKQITTKIVTQENRKKAYAWIDEQISQTHTPVFVVCPLIHDSQAEMHLETTSVEKVYKEIRKQFPDRKVGLLHGAINPEKRPHIIQDLRTGKIEILVATAMIEVGLDIPQAGIMVIESAERFGLAQLHQLRGRVGRAGQKAYCLLFSSLEEETERLAVFARESNGNVLAEYDLRHRGTGELLGTDQHGWGDLKFASWFDEHLIKDCKLAILQAHR
jgi:ATP-dependent DNA helicase RecG